MYIMKMYFINTKIWIISWRIIILGMIDMLLSTLRSIDSKMHIHIILTVVKNQQK